MNRQAYSRVYNKSKHELKDAIKQFEQDNPARFAELKARALHELEHPPERPIIHASRYPSRLPNVDESIRQFRNGRKHFFVHTRDCYDDVHLYFELLHNPEDATEVLSQHHSKFLKRHEEVTNVVSCVCPTCQ